MIKPELFKTRLEALPVSSPVKRYVVAYSGGVDSHVLLHLCQQAGVPLRAVHINHGLQMEAAQWAQHCSSVCMQMGIEFLNIDVDAGSQNRESPEDAARKARYAALFKTLVQDECLLTAHHLDDQSETLLLQLFRGAGPAGLAAMPIYRSTGKGPHARPLLDYSREEIIEYAKRNKLDWVEDPSNRDTGLDRNLVRTTLLPLIRQRWRQVDVSLSQVAKQQQDALELAEAIAAIDLAGIVTQDADVLSIPELKALSRARQLNTLRFWIRQQSTDGPTGNVLQQIVETMLTAADDAEPLLSWGQSELRRYQDGLYLLSRSQHDETQVLTWQPHQTLVIDASGIELFANMKVKPGLDMKLLDMKFRVGFRAGGEKIKPAGSRHTQSLKKLMQEAGIPPWMRSRIPLIYLDDELICVCGYWMADAFAAGKDELGWLPVCKAIKQNI